MYLRCDLANYLPHFSPKKILPPLKHRPSYELVLVQARRQLNWNGGGGMDSQYKLLSELLSDQAAFITSQKTSLANYWGALPPCPPSVYGPVLV